MEYINYIENEYIIIVVNAHGAEMCSLVKNSGIKEMLWHGDPMWWKRHSPVLFPIVGSLWEGTMRQNGKEYHMGQHGFARDMDFELIASTRNSLRDRLSSNEETLAKFPWNFVLEIGYVLDGSSVKVQWTVKNTDETDIFFQIGAHPAFFMYGFDGKADIAGYMQFEPANDNYTLSLLGEKGCVSGSHTQLDCPNGMVAITKQLFSIDTVMVEHTPMTSVTLLDKDKNPYLRLTHSAPVIGIWSPVKKDSLAPFICIEPWYGRCDRQGYQGEFCDKDWANHLTPGQVFNAEYRIDIL